MTADPSADALDVRGVTAALDRVVTELRGAADRASPTTWPILDVALRHTHGALVALGDLGDSSPAPIGSRSSGRLVDSTGPVERPASSPARVAPRAWR